MSKFLRMAILIFIAVFPAIADRNTEAADKTLRDDLGASAVYTYKIVGDVELPIYVFNPPGHHSFDDRPAVVFFFGGGWRAGTPKQFQQQCRYLASRGMVAMTADYRVYNRHQAKVTECIADAKSAIRWVRANASCLGIDPCRIASAGGSAGGHLAAAVATLDDFDEPSEETCISSKPNAMLLFNPAVDVTAKGLNRDPNGKRHQEMLSRTGADTKSISPIFHIKPGTPPTIIFHGIDDPVVPYSQVQRFTTAMKSAGNRCELAGYEGEVHGFFNFGRNENKAFVATMRQADEFLKSLGYLEGPSTIDKFMAMVKVKK